MSAKALNKIGKAHSTRTRKRTKKRTKKRTRRGGMLTSGNNLKPKKQRKPRNRTRKKKGGNGEKWLLLGITHTEMEKRKYNDPTNGGEMITFDYGGDNYDGGDDKIDIRGNYYNIELWEDLLKSKGENYFDVIFLDGGQHAGPGFEDFGDVRERVNFKGISEIMQSLLKPNGLFIGWVGTLVAPIGDGGWEKIDTPIADPFVRSRGNGDPFPVFKNPTGLRELIETKIATETKNATKTARRRLDRLDPDAKEKNMWKFRKKDQTHENYIKQIKTALDDKRKKHAIEKSKVGGKKRKTKRKRLKRKNKTKRKRNGITN
jgi:hypothetical protein